MRKSFSLFIIMLLFTSVWHGPALGRTQSRDKWAGKYEYTASLGRTAGGTGIVITYTVSIASGNAELGGVIEANGYMTDDRLRCDTRTEGNRINLYFHSYPDGGTANRHGVELYQKGDLLLSLEKVVQRKRTRYRVHWGKYETELTKKVLFSKIE